MTLIEHIEVGAGGAASIEFTSIPADYTDLYLVTSLRSSRGLAFDGFDLQLNSSSANHSWRRLTGDGSSATSGSASNAEGFYGGGASATANTFGNGIAYIPNYTASVAKSMSVDSVSENNGTAAQQDIRAMLYNSTSAVTSIKIVSSTANTIQQYSSATLYGISAGSDGTTTVS